MENFVFIVHILLSLVPVNWSLAKSSPVTWVHQEKPTKSTSCVDQNHIFLAPGVLSAGGTSRACISRFYTEGTARMTVSLKIDDHDSGSVLRDLTPGDGGCVDMSVPQLPNTKADLVVNIKYLEDNQCTWERKVQLRVIGSRIVSVQTERARYRPGDILKVRVFVLRPDLTPASGSISQVWLEEPHGNMVEQRRDLKSRLGISQLQFELDSISTHGRWKVRVKLADGSQGSASFWVGNYHVPPFQLSVRHQRRVLRNSDKLVWIVCVRYPWTEAVEGMLVIRIRGAGVSTPDGNHGIRTAVRIKTPRACHRHAAAANRIGLDDKNSPDVIIADFSFQEADTRLWQNTTVVSQVVDHPITLDFLTKKTVTMSTALPKKIKIKATRWDDKPAANERLLLCRLPGANEKDSALTLGTCEEAVTDSLGIASAFFRADNDVNDVNLFYHFQAYLKNDTSITSEPLILPIERRGSLQVSLGSLKVDTFAPRTLVPLYVNQWNIVQPITVHFAVITRGGIIYRWGATTQCPTSSSSDTVKVMPKRGYCNQSSEFDAVSVNNTKIKRYSDIISKTIDTSSDTYMERFPRILLPIKVTHQMCPESHLVVYFYYQGEFISVSKHFEMDECFANKVELSWVDRQVSPGSMATLRINTPGPALCAVTALDSASKWNQQIPSMKDHIMKSLTRLIDEHRNLTEYDAAKECFLIADKPDIPTSSMDRVVAWLATAGIRVLGGDFANTRLCQHKPSALSSEDITPRTDFLESWLWRLVVVGANGSSEISAKTPDSITRYEASAVCVARNGVGVSNSAVLQVFREFFIHSDSPKRLRQGDTTIVSYRVFNYLYEPLSVEVLITTSPQLLGLTSSSSGCVLARSSLARRIELHARFVGTAKLSIRAFTLSQGCGNASKAGISDEVVMQITIDPEGVRMHDQKSILLCGRNGKSRLENVSSPSEVTWTWPDVFSVIGTEYLMVWTTADLKGPLLANADDLVMLPRGCGEQNMARLAYNLLALSILDPQSVAATTAREHVARGFTRQLQYAHPSGGFSAFGVMDGVPSTWLTAFTVRYLRKAHKMLTPNYPTPPALEKAEQWLLQQQMENGCFRRQGQVFHREFSGNVIEDAEMSSIALTAYVVMSLLDSPPFPSRIFDNAIACLRAMPTTSSKGSLKIYAQSLLAYTFMKLRRYEDDLSKINEVSPLVERRESIEKDEEIQELAQLMEIARRSPDYVWWETASLSTSIEATGYALLALVSCPPGLMESHCAPDGRAVVRWLSQHRNLFGGFVSTQDTLVALEALIAWSNAAPTEPANLNVTIQGPVKQVFNVKSDFLIPDIVRMPPAKSIRVTVEGTGCALVQATRFYNTLQPAESESRSLTVTIAVNTDGPFNCDNNDKNCFCAAVIEACVLWTGIFPEMALLEITLPGGYHADASLLYAQLDQPNGLLRRIETTPFGGKSNLYLGTKDGSEMLGPSGHSCFYVHAVGPKTMTKAAHAKVYDYYKPSNSYLQMYTIPEECPPKILPIKNDYNASENLFNKAKSLTGELLLNTNDFNFEDVPESIPAKDPQFLEDHQLAKEVQKEEQQMKKLSINIKDDDIIDLLSAIKKIPEITEDVIQQKVGREMHHSCGNKCKKLNDKITDYTEDANEMLRDQMNAFETWVYNEEPTTSVPKTVTNITSNIPQSEKSKSLQDFIALKNELNATVTSLITKMLWRHLNASNIFNEHSRNHEHGIRLAKSKQDNESVNETDKINIALVKKEAQMDIDIRINNNHSKNGVDSRVNNGHSKNEVDIRLNNNHSKNGGDIRLNNDHSKNGVDIQLNNNHSKNEVNIRLNNNHSKNGADSQLNNDNSKNGIDIRLNNNHSKNVVTESKNDSNNKLVTTAEIVKSDKNKLTNPQLSNFHVIDSDKDLDVPSGNEGPVPFYALPPPRLSFPTNVTFHGMHKTSKHVTALDYKRSNITMMMPFLKSSTYKQSYSTPQKKSAPSGPNWRKLSSRVSRLKPRDNFGKL